MRSGEIADPNFYDCRLDFLAQDSSLFTSGIRELVIDHTTTTTSFKARNGDCGGASPPYSIGGFLAKYPNAKFGVGNGELYTFTLDSGSTNQDNQGLEVCTRASKLLHHTVCGEIQSILILVFMYNSFYRCVGPML